MTTSASARGRLLWEPPHGAIGADAPSAAGRFAHRHGFADHAAMSPATATATAASTSTAAPRWPRSSKPCRACGTSSASTTSAPPPNREPNVGAALRRELAPLHVPDRIDAVPAIPRTLSGKKLEVPVKRILAGTPPERAASRESLADPSALDWFVDST